jgi:tripartite-type tricarboxylate transporter receptor subunit TctC
MWLLGWVLAVSPAVWSQTANSPFPLRTVTLVVPFSTGTSADAMSRLLAHKLSERWGVPVVTDNRVGASGAIGSEAVAKSAPHGHTLLFTATSHGTVPALRPRLPFDPIKSFEPVVLMATSALAVVVPPQLGVKNFGEWLSLVKTKPGQLNYASPGNGVVQHLAMALLLQETGASMSHVPYKGAAGAMTDLMGGHVQASVVALQTTSSLIQSGQLQMLAVMSDERSPVFPKVPTLKELGYPNLVVDTWYGIFAPAGTPAEVVLKLNADFNLMLQQADVREAMTKHGLTPIGGKPERLGQLLSREVPRWKQVVSTAQIQAD